MLGETRTCTLPPEALEALPTGLYRVVGAASAARAVRGMVLYPTDDALPVSSPPSLGQAAEGHEWQHLGNPDGMEAGGRRCAQGVSELKPATEGQGPLARESRGCSEAGLGAAEKGVAAEGEPEDEGLPPEECVVSCIPYHIFPGP